LCVTYPLGFNVPLSGMRAIMSDVDYPDGFPKTVIFFLKPNRSIFQSWCTVLFSTCR